MSLGLGLDLYYLHVAPCHVRVVFVAGPIDGHSLETEVQCGNYSGGSDISARTASCESGFESKNGRTGFWYTDRACSSLGMRRRENACLYFMLLERNMLRANCFACVGLLTEWALV